ncbi:MAG: hypothetical protein VX281_01455, partial [Pseudomonadota bacterium]|nr:hypothetical protein [Pseudomonadota bacterium]
IAAYAIMSNHYHVVLYIDKNQADEWTDIEVVERWHSLFKGNLFSQKFLRGDTLDSAQRALFWLNTPDTSRRDKLFTNRGANHEPETYLQTVPARI